jgi:antitoxin (DNA-binding transcriptional repressor) of toxin-antitoxin stability system
MGSVGLKTLKNKLSEYVRLTAGGETVLVTDRDRVVAEIGPPNPARSSILSNELLLDAFRQGWDAADLGRARATGPQTGTDG